MNRKLTIAAATLFVICGLVLPEPLSAGKRGQSGPEVIFDSYHDLSLPLRDYPTSVLSSGVVHMREHPRPKWILRGAERPVVDRAEQKYELPPVSARIGFNFEGIPNSANGQPLEGVPSDSNLAVGATQVVETINTAYEVYDKATGKTLLPAGQISALFTGVPGLCGQGETFFFTDPIVMYDQMAKRWIITIIAGNSTFGQGNECIAVSASDDATGRYYRYSYAFGTNVLNDYDKLGVWPDAYYASYNLFGSTGS